MFPIFRDHAAAGCALMFTSGPSAGEAIGSYQGEPLYHASLDTAGSTRRCCTRTGSRSSNIRSRMPRAAGTPFGWRGPRNRRGAHATRKRAGGVVHTSAPAVHKWREWRRRVRSRAKTAPREPVGAGLAGCRSCRVRLRERLRDAGRLSKPFPRIHICSKFGCGIACAWGTIAARVPCRASKQRSTTRGTARHDEADVVAALALWAQGQDRRADEGRGWQDRTSADRHQQGRRRAQQAQPARQDPVPGQPKTAWRCSTARHLRVPRYAERRRRCCSRRAAPIACAR